MLKRLLCLFVLIAVLCGCVNASAEIILFSVNVDCADHFVEITEPLSALEYRYYSSDSHKCYELYRGICYTCGSVETVGKYKATFLHDWTYEDMGHIDGTLKHRRKKLCPTCEHSIMETLNCQGPEYGGCIIEMYNSNNQQTE